MRCSVEFGGVWVGEKGVGLILMARLEKREAMCVFHVLGRFDL